MVVNNNGNSSMEVGAIMAERTLKAIRQEGQQQLELIQAAAPPRPLEPHLGNKVNLVA